MIDLLATDSQQKSSTFRLTAGPGNWTGAQLRGLVQGGTLSVELTASGHVLVYLFDSVGYSALPDVKNVLVGGETADRYGFSVVLPTSGDFYLVVDNRNGTEAREASVKVTATAGIPQNLDTQGCVELANSMLQVFEAGLKAVFTLDALHLRAGPCGALGTVVDASNDIVLCSEYAQAVFSQVTNKEEASCILLFSVFQEIGQALLAKTKHGSDETNETMDELATALLVMFGYQQHVKTLAEYFLRNSNAEKLAQIMGSGDRHILTVERAHKVLEWAHDAGLLRRWQHVFVPNMHTNRLQQLKERQPPWISVELIEAELTNRGLANVFE